MAPMKMHEARQSPGAGARASVNSRLWRDPTERRLAIPATIQRGGYDSSTAPADQF